MSISYAGSFGWAGGGKSGATVDLWLQSRFAEPPGENSSAPAGNPDAGPVTTGPEFGSPGAFLISDITEAADYYVRVLYAGITYWGAVPAGNLSGTGGGSGSITRITSPNNTLVVTNPTGPTVNLDIANSVNLPGTPTAATASPGTNTTQIATTAFVIANSGTIAPTLQNEQFVRNQPLNMMSAPTGMVSMGYQPMSNLAMLFVQDGTAAHGAWTLGLNTPSLSAYLNATDANPALQFANNGFLTFLGLGAGGATGIDTFLTRASAGAFAVSDGTAAHGSIGLGVNPGTVAIYGNSTDTQAKVTLGTILGAGAIGFGPGGSSSPDWSIIRSGVATATMTCSSLTQSDSTAGDGAIKSVLGSSKGVSVYANSGDAQPILSMASIAGAPFVALGPGGSTTADISLLRTGSGTASLTLSTFNINDGTAGHGQVSVGINPAALRVYGNSTDTQPLVSIGSFGGNGLIGLGPGGSTATDIALTRTGTSAVQLTGALSTINLVNVLSGQSNTYTSAPSAPFTVNSGSTTVAGTGFSNANLGPQVNLAGTYSYQVAGFAFGALTGYQLSMTIKNDPADTVGFGLVAGYADTTNIEADTKTGIGAGTYDGLALKPSYSVINSGTITSATYTGVSSGLTVNTGVSGVSATMLSAGAPTGSGTLSSWIGLDVASYTGATTNIGIRNASALLQQGAIVLTPTTVTVTSNAGTVPVTASNAKFTNTSAATMTITIATSGASDGQELVVRVYDFSAAAETITWVNTENGGASVPTTSNGSTTLPKTVTFMFNSATTKWRCIASA